jgi:hypothetical protein
MYQRLDPSRIVETVTTLGLRIAERFPHSGLRRVASELEDVARQAELLSKWLGAPNWPLRVALAFGALLLLAAVSIAAASIGPGPGANSLSDAMQGIEALVNNVVFVGIALYFLFGIETRIKRRRALRALHVLRSVAHIVDMHQLTKDPERTLGAGTDTASSPKRSLSSFELTRYLDYCSELLAIVSKIAAVYIQEFDDPVTVDAASSVEDLSVGLSRAIWQKIMIIDQTPQLDPSLQPAPEPR